MTDAQALTALELSAPILASKLRNLPPQQLNQILQTKEGSK